jgi:hypothetical protein
VKPLRKLLKNIEVGNRIMNYAVNYKQTKNHPTKH